MKSGLPQKLAAMVDHMPSYPKNLRELLTLTWDVNCSPKDLVRFVESDKVLTNKLLHFLNSPCCGLPTQITSISHAMVYLGFGSVTNMVVSLVASDMVPANNAAQFNGRQYMVHSLCTAGIAKQLALRVENVDSMDCLIAGLLHDFGKVVLAQFLPKEFRLALETSIWSECSLSQSFNDIIGTDHAAVGAMLLAKWRFPSTLVETIRNQQHQDVSNSNTAACVFTANQISKKLEFGFAGNLRIDELSPTTAELLGGKLDEVISSLEGLDLIHKAAQSYAAI